MKDLKFCVNALAFSVLLYPALTWAYVVGHAKFAFQKAPYTA